MKWELSWYLLQQSKLDQTAGAGPELKTGKDEDLCLVEINLFLYLVWISLELESIAKN